MAEENDFVDLDLDLDLDFDDSKISLDPWRCCTKIFWNRVPHFSCFLANSY